MNGRLSATTTLGVLLATTALHAQPVEIGSVAAANQAVIGTPPGATQRQLQLGFGLVTDERIETAAIGAGQFVFLDQTTLNVWPNSDIVLDRYVYDPDRGVGEMGVSMTRGVLRFIGGRISKNADVQVRTPQGIVSVRGGIAHMSVADGVTRATHIAGESTRLGDIVLSRENATAEARTGADGVVQAVFVGVLSADEVQAMMGLPLGEGDGGTDSPPTEETVAAGLETSGADGLGFLGADPSDPRISTAGQVEREAEGDLGPEAPTFLDRQVNVVEDIRNEGNVTPVEPVDPVEPADGFVGGRFVTVNTTEYPGDVVQPASRGLFIGPAGPTPFTIFALTDTGALAITDSGFEVAVDDGVFEYFELIGEGPDGERFFNNFGFGDFYMLVEDSFFIDPAKSSQDNIAISVFGVPTPPSYWTQVSGPDVQVALYDVSPNLFGFEENQFPIDRSDTGRLPFLETDGINLAIIPEPNAPLLRPFGEGGGTKFVSASLGIEGEGRDQASVFSVFTLRPELNDAGYPISDASFRAFGRDNRPFTSLSDLQTGIVRSSGHYSFIDPSGSGVTTFGDSGDFIVFGQGPTPATPGAQDHSTVEPVFYASGLGRGASGDTFGDTRLAVRTFSETLRLDERFAIAAPRAETPFAATANPAFTHFFTGGYAATATEFRFDQPYLLRTDRPEDVRMGFSAQRNSVVAEFANLTASGVLPEGFITGVQINFGTTGNRSAFADDQTFAARDSFDTAGGVTGTPMSGGSRDLRPDADTGFGLQQQGQRSILASAEIVNSTTPISPEFMTWGWWSSELRSAPGEPIQTERMHLGQWVAGVLSDIADVNALSGSASYLGIAVASVQDRQIGLPDAAYVQQGAFAMTYDFADRSGAISISGILDDTFSGAISATGASPGNHYGGMVVGTFGAGSGTVNGAFFSGGPGREPALATGGRFGLSQGDSLASRVAVGVFAGDAIDPASIVRP